MAVSKVHIICVLIGFLSGEVSNHPIKWRSGKIEETTDIYDLPKSLNADDTFDIKFVVQDLKPFNITLMRKNNKTACTLIVKEMEQSNLEGGNGETIEESLDVFVESKNADGITIMVSFTIRENRNTSQTDIIQIGGGGLSAPDAHFSDIQDIADIKYIKVTGYGMKVSEFKFSYNTKW